MKTQRSSDEDEDEDEEDGGGIVYLISAAADGRPHLG